MAEEKWRRDLVAAFAEFDTDKNGKIDRAEFGRLLDALGSDMSERDRDVGFAMIDENADAMISLREMADWWEVVRTEGDGE